MVCFMNHEWSWPRKRGDTDVQVCARCGRERESKVQFDGPRYRKTQERIDAARGGLRLRRSSRVAEPSPLQSVA